MNIKKIHCFILVINLVCIYAIVQIHLGILPAYKLEVSDLRIEKINSLLSDISQGILISTFFYFLLVYIPEYTKRKSIRHIIQYRLETIVHDMQITILYLSNKNGLNTNIYKLTRNDFENIKQLENVHMNFKYEYQVEKNGIFLKFSSNEKEVVYLKKFKLEILRLVNEILNLPHITFEDENLIKSLCELRDCEFFLTMDKFLGVPFPDILFDDMYFNMGIYKYFEIYKKLSKYYKPNTIRMMKD